VVAVRISWHRAVVMSLVDAVGKYLTITGAFERPMHLSLLGLSKTETEQLLSSWDEDYQISRYMVLSRVSDEVLCALLCHPRIYLINGFEYSHLSFHADVQKLFWQTGS